MVYLASPYSSPDASVQLERYNLAVKATGYLMNAGFIVYSPIVHNHMLAELMDMPHGWAFWAKQDLGMLKHAIMLVVLTIPGWQESIGVTAEINFALSFGINIKYFDYETLEISETP